MTKYLGLSVVSVPGNTSIRRPPGMREHKPPHKKSHCTDCTEYTVRGGRREGGGGWGAAIRWYVGCGGVSGRRNPPHGRQHGMRHHNPPHKKSHCTDCSECAGGGGGGGGGGGFELHTDRRFVLLVALIQITHLG